jgi:hypothetical protein
MTLGKAFSFGRLGILFGTEIGLKFVMKTSTKYVVMTYPVFERRIQ